MKCNEKFILPVRSNVKEATCFSTHKMITELECPRFCIFEASSALIVDKLRSSIIGIQIHPTTKDGAILSTRSQ